MCRYAVLKNHLGETRHDTVTWIGDFSIFVSSMQGQLVAHPELVFQYAMNQPTGTAPNMTACRHVEMQKQVLRAAEGTRAVNVDALFVHSPRWWVEWVNKPKRNRCVADFSGFSAAITVMALPTDDSLFAIG